MTKRERLLGQGARISGLDCLDFINTVNWHGSEDPRKWRDRLHEYADIAWWAHYGNSLSKKHLQGFLDFATKNPTKAERTLEMACNFRETFFKIILAHIGTKIALKKDLFFFDSLVKEAISNSEMIQLENSFVRQWKNDYTNLITPLYPVIYSAAQLLLSDRLSELGVCSNSGCGWVFWDTSKNKKRRWCTMKVCGSRAKAKEYYYRKKNIKKEKIKNADIQATRFSNQ